MTKTRLSAITGYETSPASVPSLPTLPSFHLRFSDLVLSCPHGLVTVMPGIDLVGHGVARAVDPAVPEPGVDPAELR